ncbi:hypothetical protein OUZ56_010509 [Daphnia magna]|uniref:Uncharacterized protein n=1 Tax=Daphnia magna TaxID=35525 RepID=A0ABR0AJ53_9CRUS|nr:hypothetical protein OUZ56_010509 [Daphnia magna]
MSFSGRNFESSLDILRMACKDFFPVFMGNDIPVGAAGTLGEESEQVFIFFSRYANVSKVMSDAGNREDKKKTKLEIVQNEIETLYYEHSNMHDRIATTCKWKAHIRNKISKLNVKIKAKLVTLNALTEKDWITEINGDVYHPLTFQHFTEGAFPWEESNDASFREIFKLIDCSMLLKRKEDQPGQSMKEISQLLHSLKKSNEFHHAEVENLMQPDETDNFVVQEQELVEDLLPQPEKMLFNQAQASIKFAEIRHLQMVLNDALSPTLDPGAQTEERNNIRSNFS